MGSSLFLTDLLTGHEPPSPRHPTTEFPKNSEDNETRPVLFGICVL
jgi:hypothetical protein